LLAKGAKFLSAANRAALVHAARGAYSLARQPSRLIRGEEHDDRSDFLRLSKPATERSCRYHLLCLFAAHKPDAAGTLGLGVTRCHGIDSDVARTQFLGQRQREGIYRPLSRRVERGVRYRIRAAARGDSVYTVTAMRDSPATS